MIVDEMHLSLEVLHFNQAKVPLSLVTVDKLKVHHAWIIVGLGFEPFVFVFETWLQELRIYLLQHSKHLNRIADANFVGWVYLNIDVVNVHYPMRLQRTLKKFLTLLF